MYKIPKPKYKKSNMVRDLLRYGFRVTDVAEMMDLHQPYVSKIKREMRESNDGYPVKVQFTLVGQDAMLLEKAGQPKVEFVEFLREKYGQQEEV